MTATALSCYNSSKALSLTSISCDPSTRYTKLDSWKVGDDCCSWDGVHCNDRTGHIFGLDLSSSCLYGTINSSSPLFRLLYLTSLNLSYNNFNLSRIPGRIRSLTKLKHLNLTSAKFSGRIPSEILELSDLVSLDLSLNPLMLQQPSLKELVDTLTNLTELHLSGVNISSLIPQTLLNLISLSSLLLEKCSLQGEFPSGIFQLPNLRVLSLRYNPDLTGYLPEFQVGSTLERLVLHATNFSGQLPLSIGNLRSLTYFIVRGCGFVDLIPSSISNLTKLTALDFSENYFSGNIPSSLGNMVRLILRNLKHLEALDLSLNKLSGDMPAQLALLNFLAVFNVSHNSLTGLIPRGNQFNAFESDSFSANPGLCGHPLTRKMWGFKDLAVTAFKR